MSDPTPDNTRRTQPAGSNRTPSSNRSNGESTAPCRTCGKPVAESSPHAPFCSMRCRNADLGAWFNESYTLSRPITEEDDLDNPDIDRQCDESP